MSDLISRSELLKTFNDKNIQITFDLPVEEVLGENVDLDDFTMLVQDAIQAYKKMVIDTIKKQPTAYDIDKVVKELEEKRVDTIKEMLEIVQEVAEEYNGGWIPCNERLPEENGMYLCTQNSYDLATNKNIIRVSTELVEFYNGKWRRAKNLVVTHWQPLPKPYKESD